MGIRKDSNLGSKATLKLLRAHPSTISLFPQFTSAHVATLEDNAEFIALGNQLMMGFEFMVNNLGEPQVLRRVLAMRPFEEYFVPGLTIEQQLEDTSRVIIEALDEELGARFTPFTRNVWKKALNFANSIMAESLGPVRRDPQATTHLKFESAFQLDRKRSRPQAHRSNHCPDHYPVRFLKDTVAITPDADPTVRNKASWRTTT